jgi:hypothetical protein
MDNPDAIYTLDRDLSRDELISALEGTPERLRGIVSAHPAEKLSLRPAPDDWSPIEVVRHFRDAVQVYGMRFKWMILQDEPTLLNYDENRWVSDSPDGVPEIQSLLSEMTAFRAETVRLLRSLNDDGWSRRGHHEISGPIALERYVRHQLVHEERHLCQLEAALD